MITVAVLTGLLVFSAKIPQRAIHAHVEKSAKYLCEDEQFRKLAALLEGSRLDHYADSILLSIAYQYSAQHSLESVMWSSYYYDRLQNENENLYESVTKGYEANQQYMRYWHGSIVLVRPLLMLMDIERMYVCLALLLSGMAVAVLVRLYRMQERELAICFLIGIVLTQSYYVPSSLEYIWTFLVMLTALHICLTIGKHRWWEMCLPFFLVSGIVTNFVDFLTTELITLLVPLMFLVCLRRRDEMWQGKVRRNGLLGMTIAWFVGYVGMWLTKWLLAAVVTGENMIPYIMSHIEERLGGDVGVSTGQYLVGAVGRNISCLLPFDFGGIGIAAGILLLIFCAYVGFVYRKKVFDVQLVMLYAVIGSVPYVRYLVLHNHSYLHCFFTFRAQLATVIALGLVLSEVVDWGCLFHGSFAKRRV